MQYLNDYGLEESEEQTSTNCTAAPILEKECKNVKLFKYKERFDLLKQQRNRLNKKIERKKNRLEKNDTILNKKDLINNIETNKSNETDKKINNKNKLSNIIITDINECNEKLRESLEKAIEDGQIELANELSDRLASLENVEKECQKVNAAKFQIKLDTKKFNKERYRKLNWRFEAKERWESKANM
jgi:hypothetical protein